jgi:hypothetical protein
MLGFTHDGALEKSSGIFFLYHAKGYAMRDADASRVEARGKGYGHG